MCSCTRPLIALATIAALALGIASGTAIAAATHAVGPAQLVLRLSDLPKNFILLQGKTETAAEAAGKQNMTAAQLRNAGYVTGYANAFEKRGFEQATTASQLKGLVVALSGVLQFRKAAGAHTAFGELVRALLRAQSLKGLKMMSFPKVGDETQGYAQHQTVGTVPITLDFLIFRQGSFISLVAGGGKSMTLGKEDSVITGLARVIDGRIAANH